MKPTLILFLATILLSTTNSCKKIDNKKLISVDSMMIQYNGGFAAEVIYHAYLIANRTVLEDTTSLFTQEHPDKFDKELGGDTYQNVSHLLNEVPERLLDQNNTRFTSTAVVDGGGVTVKAYIGDTKYEWSFYDHTKDMNEPAKTFADKTFAAVHEHLINK